MVHVIVDWNCFQKGGIYRYFAEILPRIANHPEVELQILGNASGVLAPPTASQTQHLERVTPSASWFPDGKLKRFLSGIRQSIDKYYWRQQVQTKAGSVYHPTHYQASSFPKLPQLLTIHDMIPELYPQFSVGGVFDDLRRDKKRALSTATRIVTNSMTTKLDLCTFYEVDPEKVDVTPLGVEYGFSTPVEEAEWTLVKKMHALKDEPFFLYVGGRLQYKNFGAWLGAYASSPVRNDVRVVVAGAPFDTEEKQLIEGLHLGDRVSLVQSPSQEELRVLFQKAHTFVYPSLYEGFGLPILEAMSGGTPVLTSDRGAMPEVGGNAALYFNPMDRDSMHAGMLAAFDEDKRTRCRDLGPVRAQQFSWDTTAALTIEAYRKAVA